MIGSYQDSNLRVLQALAALEEHGQTEKADENSPHDADLVRLDLKMNLILDMVGQLLAASRPRPRLCGLVPADRFDVRQRPRPRGPRR